MDFNNSGEIISTQFEKKPAWDKDINWFELPSDATAHAYRLVASPFFYWQHWIEITKREGGKVSVPFLCKNWDPKTNTFAENGCICCDFSRKAAQVLGDKKTDWPARISKMERRQTMAINVIVREYQEQYRQLQAAKITNNKFSPVHPVRFSKSVTDALSSLAKSHNMMTINGERKSVPLNHANYGRDVYITYDPNQKEPSKKYAVQLESVAPNAFKPLTQEEMDNYLPLLVDFSKYYVLPEDEDITRTLEKQNFYKELSDIATAKTVGAFNTQVNSASQMQMQAPQMQAPQFNMPQAPQMQMQAPQFNVQQAPQMMQAPQMQAPQFDTNMGMAPQQPIPVQPPQQPIQPQQPQMQTFQQQAPPQVPQFDTNMGMAPQQPVPVHPNVQQPQFAPPPPPPQQPEAFNPNAGFQPPQGNQGGNSFPKATEAQPVAPQGVNTSVAPATALAGMAVGSSIESRVAKFAETTQLQLIVGNAPDNGAEYSHYKTGMQVPVCFGDYIAMPVCQQCPLKIDCNMLSST